MKFDLLSESDLNNRFKSQIHFILDPRFCVGEVLYKTRNLILANFQPKQLQVVYLFSVYNTIMMQGFDSYPGIFTSTLGSLLQP